MLYVSSGFSTRSALDFPPPFTKRIFRLLHQPVAVNEDPMSEISARSTGRAKPTLCSLVPKRREELGGFGRAERVRSARVLKVR